MTLQRPVQTGDLIGGTYRVEHVLGQGGSGVVFAARDLARDTRVAIKVMRAASATRSGSLDALWRQVRSAAAVRCEHVCPVLDLTAAESGAPCLIMEYLEGFDLASGARGSYAPSEAVSYVLDACAGLRSALAAGVVHRDLKPSKLFVSMRDAAGTRRLKLLGLWGSTEEARDAAPPFSAAPPHFQPWQSAMWVHAARYRAPEQLDASELVDARSNVWALGAILYQLLGGRPPFDEANAEQFVASVRTRAPQHLASLGAHVPEGLVRIVARALEKSRSERYASAVEFAEALAPYGRARDC